MASKFLRGGRSRGEEEGRRAGGELRRRTGSLEGWWGWLCRGYLEAGCLMSTRMLHVRNLTSGSCQGPVLLLEMRGVTHLFHGAIGRLG